MTSGVDVVHLAPVEKLLGLEGEEVDERGPGALDARGEDRLAKDYERKVQTSDTSIEVVMIRYCSGG